ncbi:B12-binding domain-containing radical SAM protein [Candidatus Omnitrophota bacterium]
MAKSKIKIAFADLTHTGHSCNAIPYGSAIVAAYTLANFDGAGEVNLFKEPAKLAEYIEKNQPDVVSFSNYIWNTNLSCGFASRIKKALPDTVVVFGGPNYPIEADEQKSFLVSNPDIDFYIFKEGEEAFVELLKALKEVDFDASRIKKDKTLIANCHYISDGELVKGELIPPISDLDEIPSPYLSGVCDEFLKKGLIPLMQTSRGCPFQCTYCQEGDPYYSQVRRFSRGRIKEEVKYISENTTVPNLMLGDANFGMYKEDIEICRDIAGLQEESGWPKYFIGIDGKNQKERILEAASIVKGSHLTAAVQSTDEGVLKNIKRQNVSLEEMVQVAKSGKSAGANSFSEVILCLPGDTKEAHIKSNKDLIEADINVIRSHQFIMLPGSEAATMESRRKFDMGTRFRVTPGTVKPYSMYGETFYSPEVDEICVENSTMSFQDYLECRQFNLTVEIIYNDGIFAELIKYLKQHGESVASFVLNIHKKILADPGPLAGLYADFMRETNEIWDTREEVEDQLKIPGVIDKYVNGEMGNNEQLMYRAFAVFNNMKELHEIAFDVARDLLARKEYFDKVGGEDYLKELLEFSLLRKKDLLTLDNVEEKVFHYDFVELAKCRFEKDPSDYYNRDGVNIEFKHTDEQKKLISEYLRIYGTSNYGLGSILSQAHDVANFYCSISKKGGKSV